MTQASTQAEQTGGPAQIRDQPRARAAGRFWLLTLAALAAMLVTAALGRWQLARGAQKQQLQARLAARARLPALDARALLAGAAAGGAQALLHRAVLVQGRWLPEHTLYLDNRQMRGRPGFFVLTPLQLQLPDPGPGAKVVLVQRGWVARNFLERTQLPTVPTPDYALVRVHGLVAAAPARLYELGAGAPPPAAARIRQNIDLAALRAETGLALADLTVLQTDRPGSAAADGAGADGLLRDWPLFTGLDPAKHQAYAVQWFALCGLIAGLYVWFQIVPGVRCARQLRRSRGRNG